MRLAMLVTALVALAGRATAQSELKDLPLIEVVAPQPTRTFAVVLSGDGGWASIDKAIALALQKHGVSVVGINSVKYFWRARTPEGAAADLARIIRHYAKAWNADSVAIVGYSRGAGVAPFMVNRLPADLRPLVRLVALLGAEHTAGFAFHLTDVFASGPGKDEPPVMPEIHKLGDTPLICFYGAEEPDTLCPELKPPHVVVKLPGGHHFDKDYAALGPIYAEVEALSTYVAPWAHSAARWEKMAMRVLKLPGGEGLLRKPYLMPPPDEMARFTKGLLALHVREIDELAKAAGLI